MTPTTPATTILVQASQAAPAATADFGSPSAGCGGHERPRRGHHTALLATIGLGLAIRLAVAAFAYSTGGGLQAFHTANGTPMYLRPAMSLLSTGQFAVDGAPELLHPPGYALLLAFGLAAGHVEIVVLTLQMLLAAATIALVYQITLSWTGRRGAALASAIFAAIEPMSIIFSSMLMTETLFTFLLVLSVQRLQRYLATSALKPLAGTAILLAAATFVRPVSYYLPTGLAVLIAARAIWQHEGWLRTARQVALFWALSMGPLLAWQVRNYVETGYSGFAAIADFNLYFFHGASVLAQQRGQPIETVQNELGLSSRETFDRLHPELPPGDEAARFRFLHSQGVRLVRQHPRAFAEIYLRGIGNLVLNPGASEVLAALRCYPERPTRPIGLGLLGLARHMRDTAPQLFYGNLALFAALAAAYLTAAFGLFSQLRRPSWQLVFFAALALYFLAVSGGSQCATRLRHPVMPLVFVLSGVGIAQFAAWRQRSRRGKPPASALVMNQRISA